MAKSHGLGRGLGSLIPPKVDHSILSKNSPVASHGEQIVNISVDSIVANPHQPRSTIEHAGLEELMSSIKEHGILQPLIVVSLGGGSYQLIAGERRWRSSQYLGLKTVPVIVREFEEQQKLEVALVENIQRRDLNAIEEAIAYQRLIDEFNITQEEVAKKVGKSRAAIANTLRLLSLPAEIQKALVNGAINYSAARVIAGLPAEKQLEFFKKVLKQDLSVRAVEQHAKNISVKNHVRKSKDPNMGALEEQLQRALSTKVSIQKTGETGKIVIEFYSDEELATLVDRLSD